MKTKIDKSKSRNKGSSPFFNSKNNSGFFGVQPKLKVGQPGDKYEVEADRIADEVVNSHSENQPFFAPAQTQLIQPKPIAESITPLIQRQEEEEEEMQTKLLDTTVQRQEEEEEETLQMQPMEEEEEELQMQPIEEEEEMLQPKTDSSGQDTQSATEQLLNGSKGNGSPLNSEIQSQMESSFGADFGGVKIHTDNTAVQLNKELGAQAFTSGNDIFFNRGKYSPGTQPGIRLLAHELTHTIQQNGSANNISTQIQRDLARTPPGRTQTPPTLTPAEIADAVTFNNNRYWTRHVRIIQDIIGVTVTGTFSLSDITAIVEWQSDFRIATDGKIGKRSLKTIILEMMAEGFGRNRIIWMIVDGHNMPRRGLTSLTYDSSVGSNAVTSGPIPGNSTVRIGPSGFSQGYNGLVHTIRHELEHVQQRRSGMANQDLREFLAESIEIMSSGMLWEGLAGFMDDARRAFRRWSNLSDAEKRTNWNRFVQVRNRIEYRYDRASATQRTTHNATMTSYNAENRP
ncbi:MAG: DUF4157 domain-containing protein [Draconibacterium sp.]|nr:DUF4157 domain-containing protein [Draconibacterium sp.]